MNTGKGKRNMDTTDIQELMDLRGWSRTRLAAELDVTENAVQQWFGKARRKPGGPACILMRLWLEESRREAAAEPAQAS